MESNEIVRIDNLSYRYKTGREALTGLSFNVHAGEIFGFLGPNGSGKTTLFRLLATVLPLQSGTVSFKGHDLVREQARVRSLLGVVFQSPSLDRKLTVWENLQHQGHLYGVSGAPLQQRSKLLLERFGLTSRTSEMVENLSGGLQRRVEIAKSLLHEPTVLLLDEPSTGLDPAARRDLWHQLRTLQAEKKVTILLTTHLMEEADQCDRLLVMDQGKIVTLGTPAALKSQVTGTVIFARCKNAEELRDKIRTTLLLPSRLFEGGLRFEWQPRRGEGSAAEWAGKLLENFGTEIESITLSQPTLEDVFLHLTGHGLEEAIA